MNNNQFFKSAVLAAIMLILPQSIFAGIWTESGDADELISTAQIPTGTGPITSISGSILTPEDVDLYKIFINDADAFAVTVTANLSNGNNDLDLFLFRPDGFFELYDADSGDDLLPEFFAGDLAPEPPGVFYLGITMFDNFPTSVFLADWSFDPDEDETGPYTMELAGSSFSASGPQPVPEPGTWAFLVVGVSAILLACNRVRR